MFYKATENVITLFDDHTKQNMENASMLQMLQRLLIALAQVKAGDTSNSLLSEIRQTIYSLHRAKQITKKVYNNKMYSIKI